MYATKFCKANIFPIKKSSEKKKEIKERLPRKKKILVLITFILKQIKLTKYTKYVGCMVIKSMKKIRVEEDKEYGRMIF